MRNRGRGGGGAGRRGGARNGEDDDDDDSKYPFGGDRDLIKCNILVASILERYDYSKPRPCVGLCYIKYVLCLSFIHIEAWFSMQQDEVLSSTDFMT